MLLYGLIHPCGRSKQHKLHIASHDPAANGVRSRYVRRKVRRDNAIRIARQTEFHGLLSSRVILAQEECHSRTGH
jgi:hypothetical protein